MRFSNTLKRPDSKAKDGLTNSENLIRLTEEIFFGTSIVKDIVGRKILGKKYSHGGEYAFFGGQ